MQLASSEDEAELSPAGYRYGDHLQEAQLYWLLSWLHSKAIFSGWWLKWSQWGLGFWQHCWGGFWSFRHSTQWHSGCVCLDHASWSPQGFMVGRGSLERFQAADKIGSTTTDSCCIMIWISRIVLSLTQTFFPWGSRGHSSEKANLSSPVLNTALQAECATAPLGASLAYTMLFLHAVTHLHVPVLSPSIFLALNYPRFQDSS